MRLYHFLNTEYGLLNIRNRRLKIARINELNDPFEFLGAATKHPAVRRRYQALKDGLNDHMGLVCFSANWNNPVQWGHYADRHRGLCLGFDVHAQAHKVSYVEERLLARPSALKSEGPVAQAHVTEILTTKFEHWSYENEYRLFPQLQHQDPSGHFFLDFNDQVVLREVIVGHHSTISRDDIAEALGPLAPKVASYKARLAFRSFNVVRQKNDRLWEKRL
ncbi:DUF2971 domain-containing protein [Xanthobacter sp. 91]|uniref:DUF2971 domain-containing protein n=1 Tax=Xanthobacter sp. 91 TaxID=1117244 RepID=UPI0004977288|nr:DUF2971 domain-containing protein [Xanthobacter sp. 91]